MSEHKAVAHTPEYSMFWNVSASGSAGRVGKKEWEQQKCRMIETLSKGVQRGYLYTVTIKTNTPFVKHQCCSMDRDFPYPATLYWWKKQKATILELAWRPSRLLLHVCTYKALQSVERHVPSHMYMYVQDVCSRR